MNAATIHDRGQALPLFVLGIFAICAMVALVIDGGNLFAQQRMSQNAVDAGAYAGAITIAENMAEPGSRTDAHVAAAIATAVAQSADSLGDGVNTHAAVYTNGFGRPLDPVAPVGGGVLPADARGVNVTGTRNVPTTFARIPPISRDEFLATADATAVAGVKVGPCLPDTPCVVMPITMPVSFGETICGEDLESLGLDNPMSSWTTISDPTDTTQTTAENLSVLPLCITAEGDFSLLDLGPDNLPEEIENPSGQDFLIPDWLPTKPGDQSNAVEDEISYYIGMTVLIPMWDDFCGSDPGGPDATCLDPTAQGANAWYHVPYMRPLLLEGGYTSGDNREDCEVPGVTWPEENNVQGPIGCLKGWWLDTTITGGPVDPNRPISEDAVIGVQLIK